LDGPPFRKMLGGRKVEEKKEKIASTDLEKEIVRRCREILKAKGGGLNERRNRPLERSEAAIGRRPRTYGK